MKIKGKPKTKLWKIYIPLLYFFKVADGPNKRICHFQSFPHCSSESGLILGSILADVKTSLFIWFFAEIVTSQIPLFLFFDRVVFTGGSKYGVFCEIPKKHPLLIFLLWVLAR